MFTSDIQTKPAALHHMPANALVANPKEEKVDSFISKIFKQIASIAGYIAMTIGAGLLVSKVSEKLSGKKIGEFPADGVAKAGIETLSNKAKDYIDHELKAEPIPTEVYKALVRFQKEAEFRQDTK